MAKDAGGHGSAGRGGGEKNTATGSPWDYGKMVGRWGNQRPSNPHPDSITGRAMVKSGEGVQLQLGIGGDAHAAAALAQGGAKSAPVATHDAHEYNRDLALRARNGQVGSGMRFRG